ncbi:hypothetical protein PJP12_09135 [Mycobacterium kansasii]
MSDFTEEIAGQIAGGINRQGDGQHDFYCIYPLPAEAAYDEIPYPLEWMQTTGIAPERITVELRRLDADGFYRVFTLGHPSAADEAVLDEPIQSGDNTYWIRPSEVLTAPEAIGLFEHYYHHHAVPTEWHLRIQEEFTTAAQTDT